MRGILADINVVGQVAYLVKLMEAEPWEEFWQDLGLALYHFEDLGLTSTSKDLEIWHCCQKNEVILITDNRNDDSSDSLAAAIRDLNTSVSLPVFTIADLGKFGSSREYVERVLRSLYEYLLRIDTLRGTGRLFLP